MRRGVLLGLVLLLAGLAAFFLAAPAPPAGAQTLPVVSVALPTLEGVERRDGALVQEESIEGATLNLSSSPAPGSALTVCLSVTETGGNRMAASAKGSLTFTIPANTLSVDYPVAWTDNEDDDPDSLITVTVVAPSDSSCSQTGYTVSSSDTSDSIIVVDSEPTEVTLTSSDTSMTEANAAATAQATVSLGRRLYAGETIEVRLDLTTTTGARLPDHATPDFAVSVAGDGASGSHLNTLEPRVTFTGHDTDTVQNAVVTFTPVSGRTDGDTTDETIDVALAETYLTSTGLATNVGGLLEAGTPKSLALFLFDADTAEEERARHVLISNLGQSDGARGGLGNDHAQAFTTGGDSDGYIVTSVDMEFARSESASALATALTVTIQSDSSGNPSGTILGTLTNPTFVSVNSDRTYEFTAPDAGIALAANTKYWFVVDVDASTVLSSNNAVRNTNSDDVDAGGVTGWNLDDDSRYRQRGSTGGWTSFHMAKKIRVKGRIVGELTSNDDGSYTVPHNWVLTPTGIGEGEKFRLLFRSSTFRNAQSTDIADYNTHVQNAATAGHAYIQRYGATFRVLGCTAEVNAKVNTGTDSGTGEPIYWLNGDKVADDYAGFYDGTWDVHANSAVRSEHGTQPPHSRWPYSGCNNDGTSSSNPLGHATVNQAVPGDGGAGKALNQGSTTGNARTNLGYYALSPVFVVGAVPEPPPEAFVPHDWPLIPSDISEGGKFRLLVLTSAQRDGTSSDIADYNTHVQNAVNGGHASIQGFSAEFKAIVSTAEVDARDNIATFGTGSPIYWLNGEKVADDYADFHDATWDSHAARNEHGQTQASPNGYFTGSNEDGTQKTGNTLGAARVQIGSVGLGIDAGSNIGNTFNTEFLGISPVFVVSAADAEVTVPANWALTPTGLNPGDKFRLLFQTSTRRDATPTDIAVYDTYVQNLAAAGHTAIQRYSSQFKVVGSTASVDARDHTSTTGTGHPIYWLNGPRVAANYAGFWSYNWENWGTSDRRTEDGTQGDNDWHWTGTDEDGTKHSNPLGNTGTNVRRGQFSTGASSRNPISHWDTDKTENHSFYAISPVFVVPTPAPTGSVPTALISLVPVKENYGDDSLTALYYNEEPHDGHELDWHTTKETTPLTFRVEHVQWPYNERGVDYDITFNLYVFDDYGFVGGTRYIPDTHTLPANQPYVDIALPITPRGNNNSGPVTIYLMGGSQKPGEVGRYLTGNRELTYFVLDGPDSGLGADDTTAIALHAASVTRNAVLHTTRHFTRIPGGRQSGGVRHRAARRRCRRPPGRHCP